MYEFNWRLEKSLYPIFNSVIENYEKIIEKYNPFPELIKIDSAVIQKDNKKFDKLAWKEISSIWLELNISMMRFYRENGFNEKWLNLDNRIKQLLKILSSELIAKWYYERSLQSLFSLNINKIKSMLKEWPINESLPFWEAKRAGLLAEIGELNEAEKILENSLQFIRKQLNLSPISCDYTWVSQESYIMQLIQYINQTQIYNREKRKEQKEIQKKFNERWNSLMQYKCDPWNELKLFKIYLKDEPVYKPEVKEIRGFDIYKISIQHNFSSIDLEAIEAYNFLRYCEEIGLPFRISSVDFNVKAANGSLKRISKYSPYWSVVTLLRIGDSKLVDLMFDRESISKMESNQIDEFILEYLKVIENVLPEIEKSDTFNNHNLGIHLAKIIPEILSRLCVKCSENASDKIFDFLKKVYQSENRYKYDNINNLVERLIVSWSTNQKYRKIPELLKIPIIDIDNLLIQHNFPEPFLFLSINKKRLKISENLQLDSNDIEQLLIKSKSVNSEERSKAVFRLGILFELDLLNTEQIKQFIDSLWSQIDEETNLPKNTIYYKNAFLNLPHPEIVNPADLLKNYVKHAKFPIQKQQSDKSVAMFDYNIPLCYEIIGATKRPFSETGIDWSYEEAIEIFNKVLEWWDLDKEYLLTDDFPIPFGSLKNEFKKSFTHIITILNNVISPRLNSDIDEKIKLQFFRLLKELDEYGVSSLATKVNILIFDSGIAKEIYDEIELSITSRNKEKIKDSINGIWQIVVLYKLKKISAIPAKVWEIFAQIIKWSQIEGLIFVPETPYFIKISN